jgi:hypothetical protein
MSARRARPQAELIRCDDQATFGNLGGLGGASISAPGFGPLASCSRTSLSARSAARAGRRRSHALEWAVAAGGGDAAGIAAITRFSERNTYLGVKIAQESRMHWKKRQKQIQYLQAKHGNDRSLAREFPDLKVEQRTAPCSNGMRGRTARRVPPPGMKQFPVGHCHKQGYELIIPGADLQWMGGKKP